MLYCPGSKALSSQQLESRGVNLQKNQWMNGSVVVDSTVGKDTLFLVTWTTQAPQILLWDPSGTKQGGFVVDTTAKMAYLQVPGIAKVWSLLPCRLEKFIFYKQKTVHFFFKESEYWIQMKTVCSLKSASQLSQERRNG